MFPLRKAFNIYLFEATQKTMRHLHDVKNGMVIKENYLYLPTAMKFTFNTTI
jgi:hypothetical protein